MNECQYWMKTYSAAFKQSDGEFRAQKVWLENEVDTINKILSECISTTELKFNFDALNDILYTKFR